MAKLTQTITLMEQIDQLIRLRASGTPQEFAKHLNISKASLHRILEIMKELGAPIEYSLTNQSYIFTYEVEFFCGFYPEDMGKEELTKTNGGFKRLPFLTNINISTGLSLKK
jgi:hypothetical protein